MKREDIAAYYDYTTPFYKIFWHKGTNALHYGIWDDTTKNLQEALINTNRILADIADVQVNAKVLDAGCGVGGSAIWLAKNRGAQVVGITLSEKQHKSAELNALRAGLQSKTSFLIRDFLQTGFPDNSFDIVWAIESVCHARNKSDFLREANRILRKGGKLVVADGFLRRTPSSGKEEKNYADFLKGLSLENLSGINEFKNYMVAEGFSNVQFWDKSNEIRRSSDMLSSICQRWFWLHRILRALRIIPQFLLDTAAAGIVQKDFSQGPGMYAVFYGEK